MAVQYMRRVIQKKAKFDIMDLNCLKVVYVYYICMLKWICNLLQFLYQFLCQVPVFDFEVSDN